MSARSPHLLIALAALAGLGTLLVVAPDYLTLQGFPLDDAWIHAMYGRALAGSGRLAYNPGIPATGATSPLWSVILALPHLLAVRPRAIVVLSKLLGFGLHLCSALLIFHAFDEDQPDTGMRFTGAALVAFHPSLVSASVSGMEIPLATLAAAALVYAARRGGFVPYAFLCAAAPLARPELAVLCWGLPVALHLRRARGRLVTALAAAFAGNAASFGLLALRNLSISGRPLPATFYAKVGAGIGVLNAQWMGFSELLKRIPIADSSVLLVVLAGVAGVVLWSERAATGRSAAAASFLNGLLFCAVSFALIAPVDPDAFYHQRYVLPALPLIVAPLPRLANEVIRWLSPWSTAVGRAALLAIPAASLIIAAPPRYRSLSNDARNIDDVQVAMGRFLATAAPTDVVWAIDAGAVRYFGAAFVVDLIGLNNAQMLGSDAQAFLEAHPPRYIEVVPTWSMLDEPSLNQMEAMQFTPSTAYTVTSFAPMRDHWLVRCDAGSPPGQLSVRARTFAFSCAPAPPL